MLKKVTLLYVHHGENATTPKVPHEVWNRETAARFNLNEEKTCCLSSDNDMLVAAKRYELHTIYLPRWMDPRDYIRDYIRWQYFWGYGGDPNWPKRWQLRLYNDFGPAQRLAAIKLLKTRNFRSDFRKSLREQLETWLNSRSKKRHSSPFSPRQWQALCDPRTCREADRISNGLYYNRRYHGAVA